MLTLLPITFLAGRLLFEEVHAKIFRWNDENWNSLFC